MNAFDTVELEPLSDPIEPEPPFPLQGALWVTGLIVSFVVLMSVILVVRKRTQHDWQWDKTLRELRTIRKHLKLHQRDPNSIDLDRWWQTLEKYLLRRISSGEHLASPSLDEMIVAIETDASIERASKLKVLEIVTLLEPVRYSGKSDPKVKVQLTQLFVEVFEAILEETLFVKKNGNSSNDTK